MDAPLLLASSNSVLNIHGSLEQGYSVTVKLVIQ